VHQPHHQLVKGRHRCAHHDGVAARPLAGDGSVDQVQVGRGEGQFAGGGCVGGDQPVLEFAALGAQLVHRAREDDPTGVEDGDLGAQRLDVIHAMAGQHHGGPVRDEAGKDPVHVVLAGRIQTVGRLVKHQQPRHGEQCGGESQPLAHAQGEAPHPVAGDIGESDLMEHLVDARHRGVTAAKSGKCGKVLPGGQRGVQPRAVHEAGDTIGPSQRASDRRPQDLQAAAVGNSQAKQQAKQRGFPGAVRAYQAVDPARRHIQVNAVERDDIAEALGDPTRPNCHGRVHKFILLYRLSRTMRPPMTQAAPGS
jgi:hypothetical protein